MVSDLVAFIDLYGKLVGGNDEAGLIWRKNQQLCFVCMVTEVDGEILLKVVGGSAGHDVFKQPSMFNCFPVSGFSFSSSSTEEVAQQVHISLSTFAFLLPHPHNIVLPLLSTTLDWPSSNSH